MTTHEQIETERLRKQLLLSLKGHYARFPDQRGWLDMHRQYIEECTTRVQLASLLFGMYLSSKYHNG